ncbi:uncharacterized protein (DUF983 family) [Aquimarina sp. MAR_2010_214]|uniref:DUF983 domain-containing protein n=1 Tax=Aquimarina sp. MAR_2010_214 TaxID=1250026 RepID=UPI000C70F68B|nr:DUF983 domain-containing protein [Aquimarina sp. MAR_2010_214]PKV51952.1 uncharacterized protein (DUF983 family) [Aquimarina sp. MAR_2010_214]
MFGKGSKLYSILFLKCPRCHNGPFLEANPYHLKHFNKVKKRCPSCQLKYSIEPSFYYGSMYVSYAVGIAISIAVFILIQLFGLNLTPMYIFITIVTSLILLMPYIGAVSKLIWANFFFTYDASMAKTKQDPK